MRRHVLALVILILGLVAGYSYGRHAPNAHVIESESEAHQGLSSSGLTNPLLQCDLGQEYLAQNSIRPFRSTIEMQISTLKNEGKATHISYYFRDLNNGSWFGLNEKETFSPASLLKVPLLIHILAQAEKDPNILNTQIEYMGGDADAAQFVVPQNPIAVGKVYTVSDLLQHMMVESDNNAALLLAEFAGPDKFKTIFTDLGLSLPPTVNNTGSMSVRDYASFFRILFNASYISQPASEGALILLSQSKFKEGIVAGVPSDVLVAHKFGEREFEGQKQLHDCGIVYAGKSPYLLCIMTRGNDFKKLESVIATLSRTTYDQVNSQAR
ncbi:MAG: serine hydrolase [Minisyncoccia bacterium]